ncbi:hypothetical protein [Embleya sp. NPDC005575]|uniref:hypothetical protein n=1 Tax=Embleya sp. NPDC005575 TaxID=3156892 RepID=UPI0033BD6872
MGVLVDRLSRGAGEFDAVFAMSVRQLPGSEARLFRMLGLLPGSSFDEYVVAVVADVPVDSARAALEDLLDAHLVQQPTVGRYRLHDLVREHARRAVAQQDSAIVRERALGRMLDYYVHATAAADEAMAFLAPGRPVSAGRPPAELPRFADKNAAFVWLLAEYENLPAAFEIADATGADVHACELPRFMRAYFARRCGTTHLNHLFERSLAAAQRLDDPLHLAEAHSDLGFARYNAGRMAEADAAYEAAEPPLSRSGAIGAQAELAMRRGYLRWDQGYVEEPLELFRTARTAYEAAGCPTGAAQPAAGPAPGRRLRVQRIPTRCRTTRLPEYSMRRAGAV